MVLQVPPSNRSDPDYSVMMGGSIVAWSPSSEWGEGVCIQWACTTLVSRPCQFHKCPRPAAPTPCNIDQRMKIHQEGQCTAGGCHTTPILLELFTQWVQWALSSETATRWMMLTRFWLIQVISHHVWVTLGCHGAKGHLKSWWRSNQVGYNMYPAWVRFLTFKCKNLFCHYFRAVK